MSEHCHDCGSELLTWGHHLTAPVAASQLVRLHEVTVEMFLGCEECSATVKLMTLDQFLTHYHPVSIQEITNE